MGSLLNKKSRDLNIKRRKNLSKGQKLGWKHKSDFEQVSLSSISSHGQKLCPYSVGPFSINKLVP